MAGKFRVQFLNPDGSEHGCPQYVREVSSIAILMPHVSVREVAHKAALAREAAKLAGPHPVDVVVYDDSEREEYYNENTKQWAQRRMPRLVASLEYHKE